MENTETTPSKIVTAVLITFFLTAGLLTFIFSTGGIMNLIAFMLGVAGVSIILAVVAPKEKYRYKT